MEIGKPKRVYTIEPIEDPVRRVQQSPEPRRTAEPLPVPERREPVERP